MTWELMAEVVLEGNPIPRRYLRSSDFEFDMMSTHRELNNYIYPRLL